MRNGPSTEAADCDVPVIGAGASGLTAAAKAGLSAARHLAGRGAG